MEMNNLNTKSIVTPEEYSALIAKMDTEKLDPEATMKIDIYKRDIEAYEEYINAVKELGPLAPTSSEPIVNEHNSRVASLMTKGDKTAYEEKVLADWKKPFEEPEIKKEVDPTRTLKKAGYIDATILLIVILNIGFILAMALLNR